MSIAVRPPVAAWLVAETDLPVDLAALAKLHGLLKVALPQFRLSRLYLSSVAPTKGSKGVFGYEVIDPREVPSPGEDHASGSTKLS